MTTADQITVTPAGSLSSTDVQASLQELDAEKAAAAFDAAGTDLAAATLQDAVRQTWQIADLAHHKLADQADALATRIDDAEAQLAQAKTFDPVGTGLDATDSDCALRQTWQIADLAHHKLAEPSGVTPGTYGGGTAAPVLTVDERGRVTGAATAPITPAAIGAAETSHTHDDRYYTEAEADARFAAVGHTHAGSGGGDAYLGNQQTFTARNDFRGPVNIDVTGLIGSGYDQVGGGNYGPLTVWNGLAQSDIDAKPAGYTMGVRALASQYNGATPGRIVYVPKNGWAFQNGFTENPNGQHAIAGTFIVDNSGGKRNLWGLNVVGLSSSDMGGEAGVLLAEFELENDHMSNDVLEAYDWSGGVNKAGIMMTMNKHTTYRGHWAFGTWAAVQSDPAKWWNKGLVLTCVATTGVEFNKNPGTSAAFSRAAIHDRSDSTNTILVEPGTYHQRFAYIQGTYAYPVIDVADCSASQVFRLRDEQQIYFDNLSHTGRDWQMKLHSAGELGVKALSNDGDVCFTVRRPDDLAILQLKVNEVAPVYVQYGGLLKALEFGPPGSGGDSAYRMVRVLN